MASEGLSLYPIVNKFFAEIVLPRARETHAVALESAIYSFMKLHDYIDLLPTCKSGGYVSPDCTQAAANTWAAALFAAYGSRMFWPKTHKAFAHVADQLRERSGHGIQRAFIPACWAQEYSYVCESHIMFRKWFATILQPPFNHVVIDAHVCISLLGATPQGHWGHRGTEEHDVLGTRPRRGLAPRDGVRATAHTVARGAC